MLLLLLLLLLLPLLLLPSPTLCYSDGGGTEETRLRPAVRRGVSFVLHAGRHNLRNDKLNDNKPFSRSRRAIHVLDSVPLPSSILPGWRRRAADTGTNTMCARN